MCRIESVRKDGERVLGVVSLPNFTDNVFLADKLDIDLGINTVILSHNLILNSEGVHKIDQDLELDYKQGASDESDMSGIGSLNVRGHA
jgi:hypothetical protein